MVNSVLKALAVIECFSQDRARMSLGQIAVATELNKTTVFNILATLASKGYVVRAGEDYALGNAILRITQGVLDNVEIRDRAAPILRELADDVSESVYLVVPDGDRVLYIYAIESSHRLQARSVIRERSKRFPRLSAWVSLADWPLQGLGLADDPLPAGCRFITFGGSPPHWPLIRNGTSPAIVAANYREMGAKAIQYCEVAIRNPTHFEERYAAPLRTIWSTNLDAYIKDWSSWIQRATGTETGPPTGIREPGVSFSRPGPLQAG